MIEGFPRFFDGFKKTDLCIKGFFVFIKTIIYSLISFKVIVILNCKDLVYLNTFQQ